MSAGLDKLMLRIGNSVSWLNIGLVAVIVLQVFLRYGFNNGLVALEELQWHLYAVIIMFGLCYSQTIDTHVRVDVFAQRLSPKTRAYIEIIGIVFLLWPFCFLVVDHGYDFTMDAINTMEGSPSPGGMPYRWFIKSVMPLSFIAVFFSSLATVMKSIGVIKSGN